MTIRVLVADDQSMVRAGLRLLLSREEGIEVVAEAGNGRDAVARAARFDPDVVLMDIRMPELDGLEVFRLIARGLSNAEIARELFISDTTVKTHVTRLLQKLELRDRAQAIVLAYQTGLFEDPDASRSDGDLDHG